LAQHKKLLAIFEELASAQPELRAAKQEAQDAVTKVHELGSGKEGFDPAGEYEHRLLTFDEHAAQLSIELQSAEENGKEVSVSVATAQHTVEQATDALAKGVKTAMSLATKKLLERKKKAAVAELEKTTSKQNAAAKLQQRIAKQLETTVADRVAFADSSDLAEVFRAQVAADEAQDRFVLRCG
jgi:hypothetical protein